MDIKLNRAAIRDKIHACWIGKNIGGTMGEPFEHCKEMLDIQGYTTPKGEPLPNDDLDLQLVWLRAMETVGAHGLDANTMGWFWSRYITGHWNEYGIGKANLRAGFLPPLCGELNNELWKHSNGAWIRTEIWACLAPGFPNIAIHYAIGDGSVDHGVGEGTTAAIFTAAMQSLAFFESDRRTIIQRALAYIPEASRVARDVQLVLQEYDKGTPYRQVRDMIVQQDQDLGWFQAPANIGFAVIGLMYGEGDFLQSLLCAINCGDDTDCTAGTVGATLGILGGTAAIPASLSEYIGDKILTKSIDRAFDGKIPNSCTELTDRILRLLPSTLFAHDVYAEYTEGANEIALEEALTVPHPIRQHHFPLQGQDYLNRSGWSFDVSGSFLKATVSYDQQPVIEPLGTLHAQVTLRNYRHDPHWEQVRVLLPDGWSAQYRRSLYAPHGNTKNIAVTTWDLTLTAGESVDGFNRVYVELTAPNHPLPFLIPLTILG